MKYHVLLLSSNAMLYSKRKRNHAKKLSTHSCTLSSPVAIEQIALATFYLNHVLDHIFRCYVIVQSIIRYANMFRPRCWQGTNMHRLRTTESKARASEKTLIELHALLCCCLPAAAKHAFSI